METNYTDTVALTPISCQHAVATGDEPKPEAPSAAHTNLDPGGDSMARREAALLFLRGRPPNSSPSITTGDKPKAEAPNAIHTNMLGRTQCRVEVVARRWLCLSTTTIISLSIDAGALKFWWRADISSSVLRTRLVTGQHQDRWR